MRSFGSLGADDEDATMAKEAADRLFRAFDRNGDGRPGGANRPNRKSGKKI